MCRMKILQFSIWENTLPNNELKTKIVDLFRNLLKSSEVDLTAVEKHIAPYFIQMVDGVVLDYDAFVEHMRKQKELVASASVEFLAIVEEGNTLFSNHVVTVHKRDNSVIQVKVIAQFVFEGDRLVRCDELTRLLSENPEDHIFGSRDRG